MYVVVACAAMETGLRYTAHRSAERIHPLMRVSPNGSLVLGVMIHILDHTHNDEPEFYLFESMHPFNGSFFSHVRCFSFIHSFNILSYNKAHALRGGGMNVPMYTGLGK